MAITLIHGIHSEYLATYICRRLVQAEEIPFNLNLSSSVAYFILDKYDLSYTIESDIFKMVHSTAGEDFFNFLRILSIEILNTGHRLIVLPNIFQYVNPEVFFAYVSYYHKDLDFIITSDKLIFHQEISKFIELTKTNGLIQMRLTTKKTELKKMANLHFNEAKFEFH